MKKEYVLIEPTGANIQFFNDLWSGNNTDTEIQLFENGTFVKISELLPKGIKDFKKLDDDIRNSVTNGEMLKKINATYHTRLGLKKDASWDDEDWNVDEYCKNSNITGFIEVCKNKTGKNAYSFATKVFSFKNPKKFPILDSITVSLLKEYCSKYLKESNPNKWGEYDIYISDYKNLIEKLNNKNILIADYQIDFKKFDIFLWTYGKVIQEYWKKIGVISFYGVEYKPKAK